MEHTSTLYAGPTAEDLARIPEDLKTRPQWVLWRGADRIDQQTGEVKLNKIPIDPQTLRNADPTDPTTWGSFDQCVAALPVALEEWEQENPSAYRGGGIGFVFASEDPYTGVDLDHCRDPDTGSITHGAQQYIDALASYTEVTPSGTGLHTIVQGDLPPKGRKKGAVEMYSYARFFTMTGWHLAGTPQTITAPQEALYEVHGRAFGPQAITRRDGTIGCYCPTCDYLATLTPSGICPGCSTMPLGAPAAMPPAAPSPVLRDDEILAKAQAAKNKEKFARLWAGDTSLHGGDDSTADMALCTILAFWTQEAAQIDRLFRQSGLMRPKWDEKRGDQTYGVRTITEALARQINHYTPHGAQLVVGAVQQAQHGQNGHAASSTPGGSGRALFSLTVFLQSLETVAAPDRLQAIFTAMADLALLALPDWIAAKPRLKALVPTVNLNDLERIRTQILQQAVQATRPAWQQDLFCAKNGELHETDNNLQAIFAHHADWQGRLWWDTVAQRAYLDDHQPLDIHYVRNEVVPWLGTEMRMPVRHSPRVLDVMRSWAQRCQRDPIQEWLQSLPATDPTDPDRTLLETWLIQYAGAEDTPYTRFVSRILLVSMVKRAMQPGCQYRYVVVLEGEEDLGKTQLLSILGDRWHQEFPKTVEGKEAYMQLQGFWLVELGELDALKPAQETRIKMFISQQMDVWIPKYENDVVERPRRAILVGTTNEREYLKGEHGNTRYFPLWLAGPIQRDMIKGIRERLFVQAKAFLADHPDDWWCIPDDVEEEVLRARTQRHEASAYEDALRPFVAGRKQATSTEAMEYLQIAKDRWGSKSLQGDIARGLKALGWYRHIEYDVVSKKMKRFWADTPQLNTGVPF